MTEEWVESTSIVDINRLQKHSIFHKIVNNAKLIDHLRSLTFFKLFLEIGDQSRKSCDFYCVTCMLFRLGDGLGFNFSSLLFSYI